MSEKAPARSFNPEFLAQLQKKSETKWRCQACYSYNDNTVDKCKACDADRPGSTEKNGAAEKRPAADTPAVEDKKPKFGGFTPISSGFNPGSSKTTFPSFFGTNSGSSASTGKTFKFGVGANAVSVSFGQKKEEEKKEEVKETKAEEDSDSDYMKYDSDGGEGHDKLIEEDYTEDEKAVDVMTGRKTISCKECITTETHLSEDPESYELYVIGSGDCGQLGMEEECTQVRIWRFSDRG